MNSMGLSKKVLGVPAVMKSSLLRIHGVGEQCFAPLHSGLRKALCNPMVRVHTYTIKDPLDTSKTRTPRVVPRSLSGSGWSSHFLLLLYQLVGHQSKSDICSKHCLHRSEWKSTNTRYFLLVGTRFHYGADYLLVSPKNRLRSCHCHRSTIQNLLSDALRHLSPNSQPNRSLPTILHFQAHAILLDINYDHPLLRTSYKGGRIPGAIG